MEPLLQAFRSRTTGKVAHIPTHIDPRTGERIVLWSDIKSEFENFKTIWIGKHLAPTLGGGEK